MGVITCKTCSHVVSLVQSTECARLPRHVSKVAQPFTCSVRPTEPTWRCELASLAFMKVVECKSCSCDVELRQL